MCQQRRRQPNPRSAPAPTRKPQLARPRHRPSRSAAQQPSSPMPPTPIHPTSPASPPSAAQCRGVASACASVTPHRHATTAADIRTHLPNTCWDTSPRRPERNLASRPPCRGWGRISDGRSAIHQRRVDATRPRDAPPARPPPRELSPDLHTQRPRATQRRRCARNAARVVHSPRSSQNSFARVDRAQKNDRAATPLATFPTNDAGLRAPPKSLVQCSCEL